MFETFPELLTDLGVFNSWSARRDNLATRVNSIQRKLYGSMFLIECAERYPRSLTGQALQGVREMRAMDAYTDAAMAQLHGALDMLASALSAQHGLANRGGRPYSFAQMFDPSGELDAAIAGYVGTDATTALDRIRTSAAALIDENNGSKHSGMADVFLFPADYPDFLRELSAAVQPEVASGKNVREWLGELRTRTNDLGRRICAVLPMLFP